MNFLMKTGENIFLKLFWDFFGIFVNFLMYDQSKDSTGTPRKHRSWPDTLQGCHTRKRGQLRNVACTGWRTTTPYVNTTFVSSIIAWSTGMPHIVTQFVHSSHLGTMPSTSANYIAPRDTDSTCTSHDHSTMPFFISQFDLSFTYHVAHFYSPLLSIFHFFFHLSSWFKADLTI